MLKYLTKFALDILPSVAATVLGAYIVNHYIANKPANAPTAAVGSSGLNKAVPKAETRPDAKPAEASAAAAAASPEVGVNAKGISERAIIEQRAAEAKPAGPKPAEPKSADTKSADAKSAGTKSAGTKSADPQSADSKSVETKSAETRPPEVKLPETSTSEPRRHQVVSRDKAMAKSMLPPAAAVASAPAAIAPLSPASAASSVPPVGAAVTADHGEAVDLARAAIERLKGVTEGTLRAPEAARVGAPPRVQEPPRTIAVSPVRPLPPLPPPITVSTPSADPAASEQPVNSPYAASVWNDDPNRPIPPADIPPSRLQPPLDLRADAASATAPDRGRNVAEDMLSAAKSMFHAVLPNPQKFTEN